MVQLVDSDIKTRDVLDWKGVHVLHFMGSSCSQKLRVFLNLKGIAWESHHIDLPGNENFRPWFLGINPRGLVPALVHDGAVHIESNDIIMYLERTFPVPKLIPAGHEEEVAARLKHEDDLHLDLRTLSFRFVFALPGPPKPAAALQSYAASGSGTVQGAADHDKQVQIEFWERAAREGFTDERARASARKFRTEFDSLDKQLARQPYLMGEALSVSISPGSFMRTGCHLPGIPSSGFIRTSLPGRNGLHRVRSSPRKSRCCGTARSISKPRAARRSRRARRWKMSPDSDRAMYSRRVGQVRRGRPIILRDPRAAEQMAPLSSGARGRLRMTASQPGHDRQPSRFIRSRRAISAVVGGSMA